MERGALHTPHPQFHRQGEQSTLPDLPMSLQMELSGLATAWICPFSTASLSAENGVKPCWERQLFTSAHTFSPTVARDSFRLKELENMR